MSNRNNGFGNFLYSFLVGGIIGATAALLTAPRSGQETRRLLRARMLVLRESAELTADELLTTLTTTADDIHNRTDELRKQSQAAIKEAQRQWDKASIKIRQVASEAIEEMRQVAAEAGRKTRTTAAEAVEETKKAAKRAKQEAEVANQPDSRDPDSLADGY